MNIYVGNLSYETTEADLQQAFEAYGRVVTAKVILDKVSGKSRGFGFVEMSSKEEGDAAISGLNGKDLKGRAIVANEARPRTEGRREGGFSQDRRGGGRGGRGGAGGGGGRRQNSERSGNRRW
ncbi:MAG: RNA-binding protein [Candidatus Abyssobacteria bacterium SURF_5]|uniref:RNA-binding protein n=1 Tax=Abyssobacteria bacterium (strain SURF_5) TaxID=2093360 RepID=A0A3A4P4G1_ABYX5|nr:MAG: RNA-binding protein [Candidatus Abyssubacteria bacterium SURF_5]